MTLVTDHNLSPEHDPTHDIEQEHPLDSETLVSEETSVERSEITDQELTDQELEYSIEEPEAEASLSVDSTEAVTASAAAVPTALTQPPTPFDYFASGSYKVRLDQFEGPLDLLLFFIKRDELDIYNIPITRITQEFLEYLHLMKALDLEVAGEFIVVAAELCQIKAKMLLPREETAEGVEEEDPRADLVRRLLEYRRFKEMSEELATMSEEQRKLFYRQYFKQDDKSTNVPVEEENLLKNVTIFHLMNAFRRAMERAPKIKRTHDVEMIPVSVEEQSEIILSTVSLRGEMNFSDLFVEFLTSRDVQELSPGIRLRVAVTFIAILDLVRNRQVALRQHDVFDEIILFKP